MISQFLRAVLTVLLHRPGLHFCALIKAFLHTRRARDFVVMNAGSQVAASTYD